MRTRSAASDFAILDFPMILLEKPADFKPAMEVVGCFVQCQGTILLLLRQEYKPNGNTWGVPAGKVDAGETAAQAMAREIFEETGLAVDEKDLVPSESLLVREKGVDFVYHQFSTDFDELPDVKISPQEHSDFIWTTPSDALKMHLIHDEDECIRRFYFDKKD